MSKNEWERGEIKVPTASWAKLRTTIIEAYNAYRQRIFDDALRAHAWIKQNRKRGERVDHAYDRWLDSLRGPYVSEIEDHLYLIIWLIIVHQRSDKNPQWVDTSKPSKLQKPKKKDIGKLPTTKTALLDIGEVSIHLDNKTKTLTYSSGEGNHAAENARNCPVVVAMFRALDRVEWKRGSGGQILGNDEYNKEAGENYEGGGGSYVTAEYSPKVKGRGRQRSSSMIY